AHHRVAPIRLMGPLGVDRPGLHQWSGCLGLAQGLSPRIGAHDALPPTGIETVEGRKKPIAANISAKALDIALAGQPREGPCEHLKTASRCRHRKVPFSRATRARVLRKKSRTRQIKQNVPPPKQRSGPRRLAT